MNCLLCKSDNLNIIESINKNDLIRLWHGFGVDVDLDIPQKIVNKYHCTNCELIFFDPENAGGDTFYSKLGEWDWYYLHSGKTEYDFVQKYIFDDIKVLDVGSGRGELFNRFSKKVNYTGIELSTKAVELAKDAGINVINEDLYKHAENNIEKYDLICLFQVLEHLTEPLKFVNAIKKCLKPGGLFIIAVPNNDSFIKYAINSPLNLPPHHTIHWKESSLRKLAEYTSFKVENVSFESLQEEHREWYLKNITINTLRKYFLHKFKSVDFSLIYRIINKISSIIYKNKKINSDQIIGHSVITVFKK